MKKFILAIAIALVSLSLMSAITELILLDGDRNGVTRTCKIVGFSVVTTNTTNKISIKDIRTVFGIPVTNTIISANLTKSYTNDNVAVQVYIDPSSKILCEGSAITNGVVRLYVEN